MFKDNSIKLFGICILLLLTILILFIWPFLIIAISIWEFTVILLFLMCIGVNLASLIHFSLTLKSNTHKTNGIRLCCHGFIFLVWTTLLYLFFVPWITIYK